MARKIKAKLMMELREQGVSRRSIARMHRMSMESVYDVFDIADERGITWVDRLIHGDTRIDLGDVNVRKLLSEKK